MSRRRSIGVEMGVAQRKMVWSGKSYIKKTIVRALIIYLLTYSPLYQ
ncbi:MAG: hypothetical protein QW320_10525 [Ignisphaera sp.]